MWTLGIDIAKFKHNASLLDESGRVVFKNLFFTNDGVGLEKLLNRIAETGRSPAGIVAGMESTGHYWTLLYQHLKQRGFEVQLINPLITSARRNIGIRGGKTDGIESLQIAKLLREIDLKKSALPDATVAELRSLTRMRFELMQDAVAEKIRLISLLDLAFPEYKDHFTDVFGRASREVLHNFPTAELLAKVDVRRLTGIISKASRGRMGRSQAEALKEAAQNSFARCLSNQTLEIEIKHLVDRLNLLLKQIDELEKRIADYLPDQQKLLQTIPGIGKVWAPTILAEVMPIFNPERRDGGSAFVAQAGLDPKMNQSGCSEGKARMSKRGSKYLRTALIEAASVAANTAKDPMFKAIYDKQIAKNKPHMVAVSHVANKLCHVIFAVLKNQKAYKPIIT